MNLGICMYIFSNIYVRQLKKHVYTHTYVGSKEKRSHEFKRNQRRVHGRFCREERGGGNYIIILNIISIKGT